MATTEQQRVVLITPPGTHVARQGIPQFFGVSASSAGATGLAMNLTTFPPGGSSRAHLHREFETSIYHVSGRVALFFGAKLDDHVILEPGTFCFIPADVPHKAYNLSLEDEAVSVTARNDPHEQENVVLTPDVDDGSADRRAAELRAR